MKSNRIDARFLYNYSLKPLNFVYNNLSMVPPSLIGYFSHEVNENNLNILNTS